MNRCESLPSGIVIIDMRIAYIISQYPEFHETFIAREVDAQLRRGNPPRIFSLKTPSVKEQNLYPEHLTYIEYSPYVVGVDVISANLSEAIQSPLSYIKAFCWIVGNYYRNPLKMVKAIAVFPKTVLYARKMRGRVDLLHAHWATIPTSMAIIVNMLTGIRFSFTAHAWDIFLTSHSLLREKITRSSGVVTCTGYNVKYLKGLCRLEDTYKIHLNYHGLDLEKFNMAEYPIDKQFPIRIIAVGRLVEQKGFVYLVRAVALLAGKGMHVHLTVIGDGPLRDLLEAEAKQVPGRGQVEFTGRISYKETIERMRTSHIFVAPSVIAGDGDRDGIPNVILEAMACGLPVIGTDVSGIPEVVIPGKTGFIVPPADPMALYHAIRQLIESPYAATDAGKAGRLFVEQHFDINRNIQELLEYFNVFASLPVVGPEPFKLTYIVSMFPCWSETFILNELVNHAHNGIAADIFSLKKCNEGVIHEEATSFIASTIYGSDHINLRICLLHIRLLRSYFSNYFKALSKLLFLKSTNSSIKIKSLAIFAIAPTFIFAAIKNKTTHLHAHFATYPALLAWLINQFTQIPYTFTAHAHDIYYNQDLLPIVCRDAESIITISDFNKQFIVNKAGQQYEDKIQVIHCGITLRQFIFNKERSFNYSDCGSVSILSVGRLSGIKGFTYLIEALRLLKNDGIVFKCNIIGDGPLRSELIQQVNDFGLSDSIIFHGPKKASEIPEFLKNADVFVLACATDNVEIHDGIPVVFMEAMAYGTPVIGTKLSGIPELIRHLDTGLCAEVENSLDIKEKIKFIITNREVVSAMRIRARKLIEDEFNIEHSCLQLRVLFRQVGI